MQIHSGQPTLLEDVIPDMSRVVETLKRAAPYTPLGGWFWPDADDAVPTRALWFQNDWVHADLHVPGSDLFLAHARVTETAKAFYGAEVIVPHTLYVNLMVGVEKCGPAHTDNPVFEGRNRTNTPMWLLRTLFWSGLFERWAIRQATSIWWMNDVEGGGFRYWPDGPDQPPRSHAEGMANTALVGDNHGMFHQVEPVGPFADEPRLVTGHAELAPADDESGDWVVIDRGEECFRAPLETFRVSVLWKAHVYADEEDRHVRQADALSLDEVARIFAEDLSARGEALRLDLERLDDPAQAAAFAGAYPEARPLDAGASIFDGDL